MAEYVRHAAANRRKHKLSPAEKKELIAALISPDCFLFSDKSVVWPSTSAQLFVCFVAMTMLA